jgi:hypothetical protein
MSSARGVMFEEVANRVVPQGRRLGLVIGIDSYIPASGIPPLRAAVADAKAIHALMVDPECGCFREELTTILTDANATETNIRIALEQLRKTAAPADEVWFFFAGHALVVDGEHRLLPVNARRDYLDATSVDFPAIFRKIRCRRKIVFLDCCHSGATDASTRNLHDVDEVLRNYEATGTITYCSSDGDQKSVELVEEGHGAFTYWLAKGLRGAADADQNGVVTSDELWRYVCEHVEHDAQRLTGVVQTPRLKLDVNGAFPLSVNAAEVRAREEQRRAAEAEQRAREAQLDADVTTLRDLIGDDDLNELSTNELKAARAVLTHEPTGRVASEIRKALVLFRSGGDRDATVLRVRGALASQSTHTAQNTSAVDHRRRHTVTEQGTARDEHRTPDETTAPLVLQTVAPPERTDGSEPVLEETRGLLGKDRQGDAGKKTDSSTSGAPVPRRFRWIIPIVGGCVIGWLGVMLCPILRVPAPRYHSRTRGCAGMASASCAAPAWRVALLDASHVLVCLAQRTIRPLDDIRNVFARR